MRFEDVEAARQKYYAKKIEIEKKRVKITLIICAIVFPIEIVLATLFLPKPDTSFESLAMTIIPAFILGALQLAIFSFISVAATAKDNSIKTELFAAYKRAYKGYFVQQQLAKFFTNLQYSHERGLNKNLLDETRMIHTGDIFKSNDLIIAKYKNTNFLQADVEVTDIVKEKDKDGRETTTYVTVFKGRYLIFEFPKKFDFKMIITPESSYYNYVDTKTGRELSKVETESTSFNKMFNTYAGDGFEAFYILSPTVIENLEKLGQKYGNALSLYFSDNKLYVGLNDNSDAFEPPDASTPINEQAEINKVIDDMRIIVNLVDGLKLDKAH
ncbi:DUF3137 domain-containing protein [Candidatus Saccharibacteria bacterium]|nr:DUF3137 domain-containing protein [Candidatus Saccharibacteria bacterium]